MRWVVIFPPYRGDSWGISRRRPTGAKLIAKGRGAAKKTIQELGGDVNMLVSIDMGIQDILVDLRGDTRRIDFKQDLLQKTTGDISITRMRTRKRRKSKSRPRRTEATLSTFLRIPRVGL